MKSIQIEKFGGPEVLVIKDIDIGKPGPKEVLIKNKSIGLNFIDVYHRTGLYPCLLYTSPSPRDKRQSRMPSSA